jgi:hypothetical protein
MTLDTATDVTEDLEQLRHTAGLGTHDSRNRCQSHGIDPKEGALTKALVARKPPPKLLSPSPEQKKMGYKDLAYSGSVNCQGKCDWL